MTGIAPALGPSPAPAPSTSAAIVATAAPSPDPATAVATATATPRSLDSRSRFLSRQPCSSLRPFTDGRDSS
jgi:hypothetical protein